MYQGKFVRGRVPEKKIPGSLVFYTVFFAYILLFYVAVLLGLVQLKDWLIRYESAQPNLRSQQVFDQLFGARDWEAVYDAAGLQGTVYESKEAFAACMEDRVGQGQLTFLETSAGLSGDRKYIVRLDGEKIGSFTLVDRSQTGIPDWQLGGVTVSVTGEESYRIETPAGHTAYVNGIPLEEEATIRIRTPKAADYLPTGTAVPQIRTQQVDGLMSQPTVTILDETGAQVPVRYDEASRTFSAQLSEEPIPQELRDTALNAVKTYALYMINKAGKGDIAKYFATGSDAYRAITSTELGFVQDAQSREFAEESVTGYCRYSDTLFSVRVSITLNLYRASGTVKENRIEQSLFFEKQASGQWLCYAMTAVDVSETTDQVRLTFRSGDRVLSSAFYDADCTELTCPTADPPEGKVFSGWMTETGEAVMELVFQPEADGRVTLPAGTRLEPMTLYPLFEDEP